MADSQRRPVIGITGSYGGLNVGDEAILESIVAQLRATLSTAEIVVFSRNAAHTRERHDVDRAVSARDALRDEIVPEVRRLDLLLLGGGGILYDREAESYLQVARIAERLGVPTGTFAIGVGPLERPTERQAVCDVLNRMQRITVREVHAKRLLEAIGVDVDVTVTADPALLLEPEEFDAGLLEREGISKERHLVGMSVREPGGAAAGLEETGYHALLATAADFMVQRFHADVLFVPMERQDIREAHRVIADMAFPEHASILKRPYPPRQVLGLMRHLDLAVGMRLHFLIFAARAHVPLLALPYASKVVAFLESLGLPTPHLVQREHAGPLLASIDRLWDLRDEQRALLAVRVPAVQARARETARIWRDALEDQGRLAGTAANGGGG